MRDESRADECAIGPVIQVQKAIALHRDQALVAALAMHKPDIWIDLSGWSPTYFPPQLVHYANTLLKDRILFGSDYPPLRKLNEPAAV